MATYEMTIYLSNFVGARTAIQEDENGKEEYGVFIPIERNAIVRAKDGRWLTWGLVQELDIPMAGFTHRVVHKTNPEHHGKLKAQGLEAPWIARMKPTRFYHRKRTNFNTRVNIEDGIDL